jgi:hypothetical protein
MIERVESRYVTAILNNMKKALTSKMMAFQFHSIQRTHVRDVRVE